MVYGIRGDRASDDAAVVPQADLPLARIPTLSVQMNVSGAWQSTVNPNASWVFVQSGNTIQFREVDNFYQVETARGLGVVRGLDLYVDFQSNLNGFTGQFHARVSPDGRHMSAEVPNPMTGGIALDELNR